MDKTARIICDPSVKNILSEPVSSLCGIGPKRSGLLSVLGVSVVGDLLWLFPRRYEDRRDVSPLNSIVPGRPAVVVASAECVERKNLFKRGLELAICRFKDETGTMSASWFNRKGIEYVLKKGVRAVLFGVPELRAGELFMSNPEFEVIENESDIRRFTGIVPVYPLTAGLSARWFRSFMDEILDTVLPSVEETLPPFIIEKRRLMPLRRAFLAMHRPASETEWKEARRRLAYEEFLLLQTKMALRRESLKKSGHSPVISQGAFAYEKFLSSLPFELTVSQKKALDEIFADTSSGVPMSRLLQGDVGSGKTFVALGLAAAAADAGVQSALVAPTEVLADQLYSQCVKWLGGAGVRCVIIKGSQSAPERRAALNALLTGEASVVTGTQALFSREIRFKNLGVVVIDEQQRFGVMQRAAMLERSPVPHMLMMSATPIPRTMALCAFGDLDITTLTDKPKGRRTVETRIIGSDKISLLLRFIFDEARSGGRIYWVCPRIGIDGKTRDASAEKRHGFLSKHMGALGVGLLHGRMDGTEKSAVLDKFRSGEIKILVGTTVVEVGVDVPEASVMVIESPERFGLSQLHQLRGRVGRGCVRGVCVLLSRSSQKEVLDRLSVMLHTDDGFEIAEADLAFRGTGELSGVRQHGEAEFKVADPVKDMRLLLEAREDAIESIAKDPMFLSGCFYKSGARGPSAVGIG